MLEKEQNSKAWMKLLDIGRYLKDQGIDEPTRMVIYAKIAYYGARKNVAGMYEALEIAERNYRKVFTGKAS